MAAMAKGPAEMGQQWEQLPNRRPRSEVQLFKLAAARKPFKLRGLRGSCQRPPGVARQSAVGRGGPLFGGIGREKCRGSPRTNVRNGGAAAIYADSQVRPSKERKF